MFVPLHVSTLDRMCWQLLQKRNLLSSEKDYGSCKHELFFKVTPTSVPLKRNAYVATYLRKVQLIPHQLQGGNSMRENDMAQNSKVVYISRRIREWEDFLLIQHQLAQDNTFRQYAMRFCIWDITDEVDFFVTYVSIFGVSLKVFVEGSL